MSNNGEPFRQDQSNFNFFQLGFRYVPFSGEAKHRNFSENKQGFFLTKNVSKLVGLYLTLFLVSCQSGPSRAQQFAATVEARQRSFERTMASIKRLPPEQRMEAYRELQADLDRQQAINAQQDLNASVQDLADAVRGY